MESCYWSKGIIDYSPGCLSREPLRKFRNISCAFCQIAIPLHLWSIFNTLLPLEVDLKYSKWNFLLIHSVWVDVFNEKYTISRTDAERLWCFSSMSFATHSIREFVFLFFRNLWEIHFCTGYKMRCRTNRGKAFLSLRLLFPRRDHFHWWCQERKNVFPKFLRDALE